MVDVCYRCSPLEHYPIFARYFPDENVHMQAQMLGPKELVKDVLYSLIL